MNRELGACAILRQALLVEVLQLPSSGSFRMTAFGKVKGLRPKKRALGPQGKPELQVLGRASGNG